MVIPKRARPAFIITIDVEADDQWGKRAEVATENARYLPRFQALCQKFGLRPTYLTEWAMAQNVIFQEFGRSVVERGAGEIGMHLHAWTTPPLVPLTAADHVQLPYLVEFPDGVIREKVGRITALLEDTFGIPVVSHRAGRWALDERYARILVERGYLVDCSVTPHVSWKGTREGPDYSRFPETPYFMDLTAIGRPGDSPLLQVPMTVVPRRRPALLDRVPGRFARRVANRIWPGNSWMRPNGRNGQHLVRLAKRLAVDGRDHVEFMIHSSEFMPGGSPYFPTKKSVEGLFRDMERLFEFVAPRYEAMTLAEYRSRFKATAPVKDLTIRAGDR